MEKKRIILSDVDGCLVDWNSAFDEFMKTCGHERVPGTDTEYSIAKRHGVTVPEASKHVREFNESDRIASLKPFADSIKYVKKLEELGFKFIVVTSISSHPSAKEYRTQNLLNLFGDIFLEINCIEMASSKANILKRWEGSDYFWIEDHMRQAEAGHEAGLSTILISHPYNQHYQTDLFPTVSYTQPWRDIFDIVCQKYNIVCH